MNWFKIITIISVTNMSCGLSHKESSDLKTVEVLRNYTGMEAHQELFTKLSLRKNQFFRAIRKTFRGKEFMCMYGTGIDEDTGEVHKWAPIDEYWTHVNESQVWKQIISENPDLINQFIDGPVNTQSTKNNVHLSVRLVGEVLYGKFKLQEKCPTIHWKQLVR